MKKLINLKEKKKELVKNIGKDTFLCELKEKRPFIINKIPENVSKIEKELYVVDYLLYHKILTVSENVLKKSLESGQVKSI